jgi:hypothetical protein
MPKLCQNAETILIFWQVLAISASFGILVFWQFWHYVKSFDFWHWVK